MSLPTFTFEVGFPNGVWDASPTWTDLVAADHSLESFGLSRGRQTEDDTANTGTLTATLLDDSRRYDPSNASSPYAPNIAVAKPVRVRATLDAVTYKVFRGWIDVQNGWLRDVGDPRAARVTVPVNDMLELLLAAGTYNFGADPGQQKTGYMIQSALNAASNGVHNGLPETDWADIDAGQEMMQSWTALFGGTGILFPVPTALRLAEITDPGFVFIANSGALTFRDRLSRQNATSQATFYDKANFPGGSAVLFDSATTRRNDIANDVTVTPTGLAAQEAVDAASQAAYGWRTKGYATGHVTTAAALAEAQWIRSLKKDSYELLDSLTLVPGTDSNFWLQVLTREINDRITVVRTPENSGSPVTQDYFIEGIAINYGPGPDASCTWRLSAAGPQFSVWHSGTAGFSESGTTTRAGF